MARRRVRVRHHHARSREGEREKACKARGFASRVSEHKRVTSWKMEEEDRWAPVPCKERVEKKREGKVAAAPPRTCSSMVRAGSMGTKCTPCSLRRTEDIFVRLERDTS